MIPTRPDMFAFIQDWLELKVRKGFFHLGVSIGTYPILNIIIPLIVVGCLGLGFLQFRETNDVRYQFTPVDSNSRYEYNVAMGFFNQTGKPFWLSAAIMAKDGGSLLRTPHIKAILDLQEFMQNRFNVFYKGDNYTFSQLCGHYCQINEAANFFLNAYMLEESQANPNVKLTHPTMEVYGERLYLANNLYGVQFEKTSKRIQQVKLIVLHFRATIGNETLRNILKMWEAKMFDFMQLYSNPYINMTTASEGQISQEVRRTGMAAAPYLSLSFVIILIFTVCTSLHSDPTRSKPWEAALGVLCPCLAIISAFGFMLFLGYDYLPIVTVAPFLILAIGVDDAFIMLHAWHNTERNLPVPQRMGFTLAEAGPSITITSLTNALSFGIGALSTTPAIQIFCTYTAVAVAMDYFFQISFFSAVLVFGGRREQTGLNAYLLCVSVTSSNNEKTTETPTLREKLRKLREDVLNLATDFLVSWPARALVGLFLAIFWSTAIFGCTKMRVELSPDKLFLADSPLHFVIYVQNNFLFKESGQLFVFVNNPGDLRDPNRLKKLMDLVTEFETIPEFSMGSDSTAIWLKQYLPFVGFQRTSGFFDRSQVSFDYRYLLDFFQEDQYYRWQYYVNYEPDYCLNNQPQCIRSFMLTTGYKEAFKWSVRVELLELWRNICDRYPEFNATVFEDMSFYADQILSIGPMTMQTVLIAICCMTIVCLFFIPNSVSIVCATVSLLSINVGVFGYLCLWSVNLDPISMATILMSIGFSVDFTAHISYHYYKGEMECKRERLRHALDSISWPMMQAGLSTVLSVSVLCVLQSYLIAVFVKTVFLVVSFGLIHGLLVLPVVLTALPFRKKSNCLCLVDLLDTSSNSSVSSDSQRKSEGSGASQQTETDSDGSRGSPVLNSKAKPPDDIVESNLSFVKRRLVSQNRIRPITPNAISDTKDSKETTDQENDVQL